MSPPAPTRALVLGGGGVAGLAWEVGVITGLHARGVALHAADAVIGTSAGAFVGAAVASGHDPSALLAAQLAPDPDEVRATPPDALYEQWTDAFRSGAADRDAVGAALGRIARAHPEPVSRAVRRQTVEARLVTREWPRSLRVTAVDAETGALHVFDAGSTATLTDAVAASGAVPGLWPLETIGDRSYIDGGMISTANAHLARGFARILLIAPMPEGNGAFPGAREDGAELARDAQVLLIEPDSESLEAIGSNPYDPDRRPPAARAGRRQGAGMADRVLALWGRALEP